MQASTCSIASPTRIPAHYQQADQRLVGRDSVRSAQRRCRRDQGGNIIFRVEVGLGPGRLHGSRSMAVISVVGSIAHR